MLSISNLRPAAIAAGLAILCPLSAALAAAVSVTGTVQSGAHIVAGATVTLLEAAPLKGGSPTALGTAITDGCGNFTVAGTPKKTDAVLYIIAQNGEYMQPSCGAGATARSAWVSPYIQLAAAIGSGASIATSVVVNERTTTAFAYAFAQFASGPFLAGPSPGLPNASTTAGNLADVTTGDVSTVLSTAPNGTATSTYAEFNSLANLLASCVEASTATPCEDLMADATAPGVPPPTDTLTAAETIATHPANNVQALFGLSSLTRPYKPALGREKSPDAWTLAVTYQGNGMEFDGPGNMAVDKDGNIWITNNYIYDSNPRVPTCAGLQLLELTPAGQDAPGTPFTGGGISGAGFGIAWDTQDTVWIGNFSFVGKGCPDPTAYSVSRFTKDGKPLSPATGFTQGGITAPQGMAFDQKGNLWIANDKANANGDYTVTVYPGGDPDAAVQLSAASLNAPFAVAIDGKGNAWVTNRGNNTVVKFAPDYSVAATYGAPGTASYGLIRRPLGVAIDSKNNAWVSNQDSYSVAFITPSGQVTDYTGGGITGPWGIAVDGADNIFVSNFGGKNYIGARVTELCGAAAGCGPGVKRGDPISPAAGYTSNAFTRLTGVSVDQAGNVWVPDNWEKHELQTNPGAHYMVELVGLAAPVKAPLLGPPQQP